MNGEPMPNFSKILERENKIVRTQIKGIRNLLKSRGITLKEGRGRLISPKEVRVTLKDGSQEIVETDKVIIATGSRPSRIPVFPFDGKNNLNR
jgi:dihydrolipoamide dehydrogenase